MKTPESPKETRAPRTAHSLQALAIHVTYAQSPHCCAVPCHAKAWITRWGVAMGQRWWQSFAALAWRSLAIESTLWTVTVSPATLAFIC